MLRARTNVTGGRRLEQKIKELEKLSNAPTRVKVGLPVGSLNYPDGTSLIMVGAVQEFGSNDGRIPERSYLRATVINKQSVFRAFWRQVGAQDLLTGEEDAAHVLNLLGQLAESEVKKTITELQDPPNTEETIERKGSSNPLIDTGLLRQSIRYEVSDT